MKIPQKAIEEMIVEVTGPLGLKVYTLLKSKEDVDEFIIAEKLKVTINELRKIMYNFEKYNLITSNRKKDRKKGWYIYFYTLNKKEIENTVLQLKKDRLRILETQLQREEAHEFYYCPNKDVRLTLENAMEHNFTCFECGAVLIPEDRQKNIKKINIVIKKRKEEIQSLMNPSKTKKK